MSISAQNFPGYAANLTAGIGFDVDGQAVEVGDDVWGEWHYTKAAGQELRGVIVITVRDGLIRRSRFYMEPVDTADAAIPGGPLLARD